MERFAKNGKSNVLGKVMCDGSDNIQKGQTLTEDKQLPNYNYSSNTFTNLLTAGSFTQ